MNKFYQKNKKEIVFYVLVITLFLGICSFFLLAQGMFFDGVLYAQVSKNMALGKGSFWSPYLSPLTPEFYEHPPLVFFIESLPFRIFGTSILVERFFSVLNFVAIGFLIIAIWKQRTNELKSGWLPLFLYFCMPLITWAVTNNLLDSTLSVFACLSVYMYFKSVKSKNYLFVIFSGLSICLGVLCKGPVAFFPYCFPFLLWLITREISFKRMLIDIFSLLIFSLLPIGLAYFFSESAKNGIGNYFSQQVAASLLGERNTVDNRFHLIGVLLNELIIPLVIVCIAGIFLLIKRNQKQLVNKVFARKEFILFLFLALAGSLPIMFSMKQRAMYLIPSMPFFAISLAFAIKPFVDFYYEKIKTTSFGFRFFKIFVAVAFIGLFIFTIRQSGTIARDKEPINIVKTCGKVIPPNTIISTNEGLREHWTLQAYFSRMLDITMDAGESNHSYFLSKTVDRSTIDTNKYEKILEIEDVTLFKRKD